MFDENFKLINKAQINSVNYEIINHKDFNSFSLVDKENYGIIIDSKNNINENLIIKKFIITTDFSHSFSSQKEKPNDYIEIFSNKTFEIDTSNKYYVYTENNNIFATSDKNIPFVIDFCDENNIFVKTRDNKTINISLYSIQIEVNMNAGNLTAIINGKEKILGKTQRLMNNSKVYYYPHFDEKSYIYSFTYSFYLKSNTKASKSSNIAIYVCKMNCSCNLQNYYCQECLENYWNYGHGGQCIHISDLKNKFYDENLKVYLDCYYKCKTCSKIGYNDYDMGCLTCYEEYGDYFMEGGCYEKKCDNLFFRDKDSRMKICINDSICPEEYPVLNITSKECQQEKFEIITTMELSDTKIIDILTIKSSFYSEKIISNNFSEIKTSDSSEITKLTDLETINITNYVVINESASPKENSLELTYNENKKYQKIIDLLKKEIGEKNIDQINGTYSTLSNLIQKGIISSFEEDIIISGINITYQLTTTESQKNSIFNSNISTINFGECEKIIKRNISYEYDPTPLLLLKIDVKKNKEKTTSVEYEVYNPYTRKKIDLSICKGTNIQIYTPVNLNQQETFLYSNLKEQGYDLFDVNNSFYIDPCTQYTSPNGTDAQLTDRKDYFYNEDIVLCEDICKYINVNIQTKKAYCECNVKTNVNIEGNQEFSPQKLMENFYKVDAYINFEVLFCYKLVFSSKGLKKNICFFILLVLFISFFISMIINLFKALKKIEEIIFNIFQEKYMFQFFQKIIMNGRKKRNVKINNNLININNKNEGNLNEKEGKTKLNWFQRLKLSNKSKNKNLSNFIIGESIDKINNKKNINKEERNSIKIYKKNKKKKKKLMNDSSIGISSKEKSKNNQLSKKNKNKRIYNNYETDVQNEVNLKNNIINDNNSPDNNKRLHHSFRKINQNKQNEGDLINSKKKNKGNINIEKKIDNLNINIINNIMNHPNPPLKKTISNIHLEEKNKTKDVLSKKDKKIKKNIKDTNSLKIKIGKCESNSKELVNSFYSNTPSASSLDKYDNSTKFKLKKSLFSSNQCKRVENKKEKKKGENQPKNKNIKYIDEELNRMEYEMALKNDKRNFWQYYFSLLKKKHIIFLTFISNNDYNVFLLKYSLFILSLVLFFSINTLFYNESCMHNIFTKQGAYSLIYQIPQVLYSTLISSIMTFILKKLSLSQDELIAIKKEPDKRKSQKLANESKKCLKIKLYLFFFFGNILILFFWYYITAFAAVYPNTQIHLIKDTLLSFGISMSYPFFINLIPGIFRFPSLKSGNKECLYKVGQIISLL